MQLAREAHLILHDAGFEIEEVIDFEGILQFESANLVGVIAVLGSVQSMIENWTSVQDRFLRRNGAALRRDPLKAWNAYTVLLVAAEATDMERAAVHAIEENVSATRKIARVGIATKMDLRRALAPLLPLLVVDSTNAAASDPMRAKLNSEEMALYDLMRNPTMTPTHIASWIMGVEA